MLFKSKKLERKFRQNGYVVIADFLPQSTIDGILELYESLKLDKLEGIYTNIKDKDLELNEQIDHYLKNAFHPFLERYFHNFFVDGGVFIVKGTGEKSESTLHQDWNIIDEREYISCCVWCPLVDVDESNGCLQIIPESNNWFKSIRSLNIAPLFVDFKKVKKHTLAIPIKKGSAIIFAHNVFHGSKPNYTNILRPVATVSIIPKNARPIHYLKNRDKINIIKADKLFYQNEVKKIYAGIEPDVTVIDQIDYQDGYVISNEKFMKTLNKNTNIFKRIFRINL